MPRSHCYLTIALDTLRIDHLLTFLLSKRGIMVPEAPGQLRRETHLVLAGRLALLYASFRIAHLRNSALSHSQASQVTQAQNRNQATLLSL